MFKFTKILIYIIYPASFAGFMIFCLLTCGGDTKSSADKREAQQDAPRRFVLPLIPGELKAPEARAGYLAVHYWDNFDFSDTAYVHLPEITEQALVDYLDIFSHTDQATAAASISAMLDRTLKEDHTGRMYRHFLSLYKDYLYDPNSPMRNEEYYIPVANYILESVAGDQVLKSRASFDLSMMLKNRKGDTASDIFYTLANGQMGSLHNLSKDYTILFFYDPDCPACKETARQLKTSPLVNGMLSSGKLAVLALYPDEDIALWRKYIPSMPSSWINAYDKERTVRNKVVYDLKAIPSLYLLDRNKQVLLKDANASAIQAWLSTLPE